MYVHASALLDTYTDAFLTVWLPGSIYSLVLGLNMLSLLRLCCACKIRTFLEHGYRKIQLLLVAQSSWILRTRSNQVTHSSKTPIFEMLLFLLLKRLTLNVWNQFLREKNDQNDQHPQFHLWFIKVSWCKCKGNCVCFTQIALRTYTRHVPRCSSLVLWQFYGHVCVSFPLYSTRNERTSFCDLDSAIQHYKTFISWYITCHMA